MANRIDDIFSVSRLRQNWQAGAERPTVNGKVAVPAEKSLWPGPLDTYEELEKFIGKRFPGGLNPGLELLLGQLLECLLVRFPPEGAARGGGAEEKAASGEAVARTLDSIEDLFEALELGDGGQLK